MRRTIRFRITAVAVVLSGVLLVGVALVMVTVVRSQLTDNLDESSNPNQRADTIESVLSSGFPSNLPGDEDLLVQVVDAGGTVLASSANLVGNHLPHTWTSHGSGRAGADGSVPGSGPTSDESRTTGAANRRHQLRPRH